MIAPWPVLCCNPVSQPSSCWGLSAAPLPAHVMQQSDSRDLKHHYQSLPKFSLALVLSTCWSTWPA